jgi:hypothetical protein
MIFQKWGLVKRKYLMQMGIKALPINGFKSQIWRYFNEWIQNSVFVKLLELLGLD